MTDPIVTVEKLGKRYRLRHAGENLGYTALREVLTAWGSAPFRWWHGAATRRATREDFWALRDVNFAIAPGEVVGIIGRNGAGKSTLLKILSRITEPTEGRVTLYGRVASLLEVGTGFHPELTGRENVFLNGAILGMSRIEIHRRFDEIVAFAEVETFLDTPVKHYSSGMYMRLAFAVAAHLEPQILIVDEVLAVGDAEFQKKCLGKMREVSRGGRTVLFVSHNIAAVLALCGRAIWLQDGIVAADGAVNETTAKYLAGAQVVAPGLTRPRRISAALELRRFDLTPNPALTGATVGFSVTFAAVQAIKVRELVLLIYSSLETRLAIIDLRSSGLPVSLSPGQEWAVKGQILKLPLVEGDYRFGLWVASSDFTGDVMDLVQLTMQGGADVHEHVPYPVEHRGVLELQFQVDR